MTYQPVGNGPVHNQPSYNPYAQPPPPQVVYAAAPVYAAPPSGQYVPPHSQGGVPSNKGVGYDAEAADYSNNDSRRFPKISPCRDMIWSILFLLHIIGMVTLAIVFYSMYKNKLANTDNSNDPSQPSNDNELKLDSNAFSLFGIFIALGIISALLWLELFKRFARPLIWASLLFSPVFCLILGAICFLYLHQPVAGVIFVLVALLNLLFIYFVRSRIQFSANILTIAVQVLQIYPATTVFAFATLLVQIVWVFVWIVAAAGAMHSLRNQETTNPDGTTSGDSDTSIGLVYFFLLISFYWTMQVAKNVCHVTVAGTMATWYFLAPNGMPENPTLKSFQRATWSSFGSICLGSLIIAVVKALRAIAQSLREADHPVVRCIVLCVLGCLESMVEYFNTYAFTQIAIYGKPYCAAAKDTFRLLTSAGLFALINDNLIGTVLFFASFVNGLLGAGFGALLAKYYYYESMWGLWALIGFITVFGLSMIVMEVIESAVVSFFVCWAEDPAALNQSKPLIYEAMVDSITRHKQVRPQIFVNQPNPIPQQARPQQQY